MEQVKANQIIIDCMAKSVEILNNATEECIKVFGQSYDGRELADAHNDFYNALKKTLNDILDEQMNVN